MDRYRKKPVVIEAVKWAGVYGDPPCVKMPGPGLEHLLPVDGLLNSGIISTLEGDMVTATELASVSPIKRPDSQG